MKYKHLILLALAFTICCGQTFSQKNNRNRKKKAKTEKVDEAEMRLIQMMQSTQKITFIDSVVIDKAEFLKSYCLSEEIGKIIPYAAFFNDSDTLQRNSHVYVNEFGDNCIFSKADTTGRHTLYSCDRNLGPKDSCNEIKGLSSSGVSDINFPFLMGDGYTLYFAAKGTESIGGYDIFVTRYDHSANSFLKPENIGMPFNSTANDYMYVIDEYANIGWFATDRNQAENKVCVYSFIPSPIRQSYTSDTISEQTLKNYSMLHSIAATWGDGKERKEAKERIANIKGNNDKNAKKTICFILNNKVKYESLNDFKNKDNIELFKEVQLLYLKLENINKAIAKAREFYKDKKTPKLKGEILESEKECLNIKRQINLKEKHIRETELKTYNQ